MVTLKRWKMKFSCENRYESGFYSVHFLASSRSSNTFSAVPDTVSYCSSHSACRMCARFYSCYRSFVDLETTQRWPYSCFSLKTPSNTTVYTKVHITLLPRFSCSGCAYGRMCFLRTHSASFTLSHAAGIGHSYFLFRH